MWRLLLKHIRRLSVYFWKMMCDHNVFEAQSVTEMQ